MTNQQLSDALRILELRGVVKPVEALDALNTVRLDPAPQPLMTCHEHVLYTHFGVLPNVER